VRFAPECGYRRGRALSRPDSWQRQAIIWPVAHKIRTDDERQLAIFFIGLTAYAFSFVLVAVNVGPTLIGGFECAIITSQSLLNLLEPRTLLKGDVLKTLALLGSGSVNIIFLVAVIFRWSRRGSRVFAMSRVIVLIMILCCWVVMYGEGAHPREGHFLWIVGMLLVLFCGDLSKLLRPRTTSAAARPA
jgi:hypothetical protein